MKNEKLLLFFGFILFKILRHSILLLTTIKHIIYLPFIKSCWIEQTLIQPKTMILSNFDNKVALFGLTLLHNFELAEFFKIPFHFGEMKFLSYVGNSHIACVLSYQDEYCVLFRGTQTKDELKSDLNFLQKNNLHQGFLQAFEEIQIPLFQILSNASKIIVFGHSFGAALATITLHYLKQSNISGYGFGSPRVGNPQFASQFTKNWFNIMNTDDLFTKLPFKLMPNIYNLKHPFLFEHVGKQILFSKKSHSYLHNHLLPIYGEFLKEKSIF